MAKAATVKSQEHTFEFLHKYLAQQLPAGFSTGKETSKVELQDRVEFLGSTMIVHWKQLANKLVGDEYTCTFYAPATWWQMFKQEAAPAWFRRWYPIRVKPHRRTVKFTRYATYPQANMAIPQQDKFRIILGPEVIEDNVTDMGDLK